MYCRGCSYPLAPDVATCCAECGREFDPADPRTWAVRPATRVDAALRIAGHIVAFGLLGMLGFVCWLMVGIDMWVGASANAVFVLICAVIGAVLIVAGRAAGRSRWYLAPAVPFAIFMLVYVFVDISRMSPLMRALDEMESAGATRAEAKAIMDRAFPDGGRFPRPVLTVDEASRLSYQVDPNDGMYNAAYATVLFAPDGTVESTQFVPD